MPPNCSSDPTQPVAQEKTGEYSRVVLRCPNCHKRLPLGGTLCMCGTTGVFCRSCGRIIEITMRIVEE